MADRGSSLVDPLSQPLDAPLRAPTLVNTPAPAPVASTPPADKVADRLRSGQRMATTTTPDRAARIFAIQRKTGFPTSLVDQHLDALEKQLSIGPTLDVEAFRRSSPLLANWLASDEGHLAIAQDDLAPLAGIDAALRAVKNVPGFFASGPLTLLSGALGAKRAFGEALGVPRPMQTQSAAQLASLKKTSDELATVPANAGWLEQSVYSAAQSVGLSASLMPLAVLSGGSMPLLAAFGVSTGGQAVEQAREQGVGLGKASAYGAFQGGVEIATELLPMHRLFKDLAENTGLMKTLMHQAVTEGVGEEVATILQDAGDWATLHPEQTFGDYLNTLKTDVPITFLSTLMAAGAQTITARGLNRVLEGVSPSQSVLDKAVEAANESKLLKTDPIKFKEYVESVAPGQTVAIPVERFTEFYQERGENPHERAAALTGDEKAYTRALVSGGDLHIPMATYLAEIGPTDAHAALAPHIRLGPMDVSTEEQKAVAERLASENAGDQAAQVNPREAEIAAAHETLVSQLEAAGVERSTAQTMATSITHVLPTVADRAGLDVAAVARDFLPTIEGSEGPVASAPLAAQTFHQASQDRIATLKPAGGPQDSRAVPFQTVDSAEAERLFRAQDSSRTHEVDVPIADLVATQPTVSGAVLRGDAPVSEGLPTAIEHDGKFYLSDGTHRAVVAWANGETTIRVQATPVRQEWLDQPPMHRTFLDRAGAPLFQRPADAAPVATLTGDEFAAGETDIKALRAAAIEYYTRELQHGRRQVERPGFGVVTFTDTGKREVKNTSANPEKLRLIPAIAAIIERGTYEGRAEPYKLRRPQVVAYHYFSGMVQLGDRLVPAGVTVEEHRDGHLFYNINPDPQALLAKKKARDGTASQTRASEPPEGGDTLTQSIGPEGGDVNLEILRQDSGPKPKGIRGSITFGAKPLIQLFEARNLSTFWHEAGHLYLQMLRTMTNHLVEIAEADRTPTQQQLIADMATLDAWLVDEDHAGPGFSVKQHEQFARAHEAFVMEGKAPSVGLRHVFARAASWLLSIYKDLQGLSRDAGFTVRLNDDVRGVMARLYASDEAIAHAETEADVAPLFVTADDAGWSPAVFAAYQDDIRKASEQARTQVQQRLMHDIAREREASWQAERETVRAEVAAAMAQKPEYVALAAMQRGEKPDGTPLDGNPGPLKLSKVALVQQYGKEILARLPKPWVYAAAGGQHPDVLAELLGYPSGAALVNALLKTVPIDQAIDATTDAEMQARHGNRLLDGTLADEARAAVMTGDARDAIHDAELAALTKLARGVAPAIKATTRDEQAKQRAGRDLVNHVPSRETLREVAARQVAQTAIRDLRPDRHFAAARTAARKAIDLTAAKDYVAALAAKVQHLLNLELYRAALAEQQLVEQTKDDFAGMFRPDSQMAKTRNMDFVAAARAVAARYYFPKKALGALDALEKIRTYDQDLYETLREHITAAFSGGASLSAMTVEQFRAMRDTVLSLWKMSRRSQQMVIDGQLLDRAVVRAALVTRLDTLGPAQPVERTKAQMYLLGARARTTRVEHWVAHLDADQPDGVFRRYLHTPIIEATTQYRLAKKTMLASFLELVKPIEATLNSGKVAAPELGYTFDNLGAVLHAIAHTGNDSNFQKLLRGYKWGQDQEDGVVDRAKWDSFVNRLITEGTLTKAHFDTVQAFWDMNEALKPEAQHAHREMYGHYFADITARPFTNAFGTYRGGYVPAIVDTLKAPDAAVRADKQALLEGENSFMFPTTGRGFTKARVEAYAKPLALDLRLLPQHMDKVLRFVHIEPAVKDVGRLVFDRDFRARLDAYDPTAASGLLVPWLQRAASQRVSIPATDWAGKGLDAFFRGVRARTGLNIMAANVVNTLQQFTGLSIAGVDVRSAPAWRNALWEYTRAPRDYATWVHDTSPFMATLLSTQGIEIQQTIDEILVNSNSYETVREFARKHGYFMQGATQNIVNLLAWGAAYNQAMAAPTDGALSEAALHRSAVLQADATVRMTQGTFAPEDVSRFEVGTPVARAFTMFSSYFNMQANLLGYKFATIARDLGLRKGVGRGLYVYALGFMLPAVLGEMIRRAIVGAPPDDEDDESYLSPYMGVFFGSQWHGAAGLVPFVGSIAIAVGNSWNDKPWDDRISTSPAIASVESTIRATPEAYRLITEGTGSRRRAVMDAMTAIGMLTGLPTQPLGKPLGYLAAVGADEDSADSATEIARGLLTGRSAPAGP